MQIAEPRFVTKPRRIVTALMLVDCIVFLDQLVKNALIYSVFAPDGGIDFALHHDPSAWGYVEFQITSFFNLVLVWNKGVSFGFMSGNIAPIALSIMMAALIIVLTIWMFKQTRFFPMMMLALAIGGAIGNVIDRLRFGAVIDFLDFHIGTWHWPAFNIADCCICIGLGLLIIDSFCTSRAEEEEKAT